VCFLCTGGASIRLGIFTRRMCWFYNSGGVSAISHKTMARFLPSKNRADFSSKCKKSTVSDCHNVAFAVKLIYESGIGNDVMDGPEQ
jgi:hypothetical protein